MKHPNPALRRLILCLFVVLVAGVFTAQGRAEEAKTLDIVTTLFPQYDFSRIIGGDKVTVKLLLPSGSDPHAFDPRPSDIAAIANADIFAYTGAEMEPWAEKVLAAMKDSGAAKAIDLSAGMQLIRSSEWNEEERRDEDGHDDHDADEHGHDHDGGEHDDHDDHDAHGHDDHGHAHILDPHIWLDPVLAMTMADTLRAAMCDADPANAAYYTANAAALRSDLQAVDAESRALAASAARRTLVFGGRFAFAYFTKRYGFNHIGAYDSCGAGAEPSVKRILEVTDYVKEHRIPVIYHEEGVEPRISLGIADATGCRTLVAHSLHNLTAEELAAGVTFADMMRRNIRAFAEGLR